jgi:hypothetical protein
MFTARAIKAPVFPELIQASASPVDTALTAHPMEEFCFNRKTLEGLSSAKTTEVQGRISTLSLTSELIADAKSSSTDMEPQ